MPVAAQGVRDPAQVGLPGGDELAERRVAVGAPHRMPPPEAYCSRAQAMNAVMESKRAGRRDHLERAVDHAVGREPRPARRPARARRRSGRRPARSRAEVDDRRRPRATTTPLAPTTRPSPCRRSQCSDRPRAGEGWAVTTPLATSRVRWLAHPAARASPAKSPVASFVRRSRCPRRGGGEQRVLLPPLEHHPDGRATVPWRRCSPSGSSTRSRTGPAPVASTRPSASRVAGSPRKSGSSLLGVAVAAPELARGARRRSARGLGGARRCGPAEAIGASDARRATGRDRPRGAPADHDGGGDGRPRRAPSAYGRAPRCHVVPRRLVVRRCRTSCRARAASRCRCSCCVPSPRVSVPPGETERRRRRLSPVGELSVRRRARW